MTSDYTTFALIPDDAAAAELSAACIDALEDWYGAIRDAGGTPTGEPEVGVMATQDLPEQTQTSLAAYFPVGALLPERIVYARGPAEPPP